LSTYAKIETTLHKFQIDAPISQANLGLDTKLRDRIINLLLNSENEMMYETNVKAKMTSYSMHKTNADFKTLSDIILNIVKNVMTPEKLTSPDKNQDDLYTMDCWGVVYSKGHEAIPHHHLPALWSWCYYLKCPEGSSPLVFSESNIIFEPKEDELVFFPSYISHHVPTSVNDQKRIMIAGNIGLDRAKFENIDAELKRKTHYDKGGRR
jgi:hypothetical protein|tara:strand:- start:459 stop:1085 length:627 start_codon:yes stop_codon:yes gene_type:complete